MAGQRVIINGTVGSRRPPRFRAAPRLAHPGRPSNPPRATCRAGASPTMVPVCEAVGAVIGQGAVPSASCRGVGSARPNFLPAHRLQTEVCLQARRGFLRARSRFGRGRVSIAKEDEMSLQLSAKAPTRALVPASDEARVSPRVARARTENPEKRPNHGIACSDVIDEVRHRMAVRGFRWD